MASQLATGALRRILAIESRGDVALICRARRTARAFRLAWCFDDRSLRSVQKADGKDSADASDAVRSEGPLRMETGLHARKIWIFTIRRDGLDCCDRDPPLFARIVASQRHYNVHCCCGIFRLQSWILLRGPVDGVARFGSESSRKTWKTVGSERSRNLSRCKWN